MDLFQKLLDYYGFSNEEYQSWLKRGDVKNIPSPAKTLVFNPMIEAIKKAIALKSRFIIYGDYDVDGITATAIMVRTLKALGAEVGFFIPSRYKEGYGLNSSMLPKFKERGYDFLICVDNGITKFIEVEEAKRLGFQVVIIDHHEALDSLPNADYIFQQFVSGYTDYNVSAAFLALMVSEALTGEFDHYSLTLAGMAVLSDMMPLVNSNVDLVKLAITNLKKYRYHNLTALFSPTSEIDLKLFNFEIIPILNAPGRLKEGLEPNDVVRLLIETDGKKIFDLASKIIMINQERKKMVSGEEITQDLDVNQDIIFFDSSSPLGIGGLIANRIFTTLHKPVVVFSKVPNTDSYLASIRTPKNYNIIESLKPLESLLLDYGGHANAAGFSLKEKQLAEAKEMLKIHLIPNNTSAPIQKVIKITTSDIDIDNVLIIESFGPFGNGHPSPLFALDVDSLSLKKSDKNPAHIITNLQPGARLVFFNGADKLPSFGEVCLFGRLSINNYFKQSPVAEFFVESTSVEEFELVKD